MYCAAGARRIAPGRAGGSHILAYAHTAQQQRASPLIGTPDEIVANLPRHKMILGTGAGTRARHVYSLAIDLGLPVGVLTVLGTAVAWQNAQMLHYLMARHGIAFLEPEGFPSLPHYLMERGAVICQGMPPYKLWEQNPDVGRIPPQRTDTGACAAPVTRSCPQPPCTMWPTIPTTAPISNTVQTLAWTRKPRRRFSAAHA